MPKPTGPLFICSNCDAQFQKWTGRCLECQAWGTVTEASAEQTKVIKKGPRGPGVSTTPMKEVPSTAKHRITTTIDEVDRVLGGGIVPGSFILLGGEPGIGKSTLSLQVACLVPNTIYLSGEESVEQIKLRAERLNLHNHGLRLGNTSSVDDIVSTIINDKPPLIVVDSIQTLSSEEAQGEPGNITQIRASTVKLLEAAKRTGTAIILIGHVTKDGTVAGPRTLEHLVDTVLYLEGDRHHGLRMLRTAKNRFGSTDEVGLFDMEEAGLVEVKNPSALLLAERGEPMSGSILTCLLEGTRPLLVEIQALVNKTTFGYPVRKASGFDLNRLHVLIAVLERRAGLHLGQYDVHVNVVGGVRANEPSADLAVALAIASAYKDKALGQDLVVFGEVGLGGEVRSIRYSDKRIKESEHLGMKRVITAYGKHTEHKGQKVQIISVKNIQELISHT